MTDYARLTRNAARCNICGDTIESRHRHDFRRCSCGNVFVDGGLDYRRCGWTGAETAFEDLCEYEPAPLHNPPSEE